MAEEETVTATETADTTQAETTAKETTAVETAEAAEKPESETAEKPDAESETAPEPKSKPDKAQKKIAEMRYKASELRRENDRLKGMLEEQAKAPKTDVKAPQLEKFDTFEDYLDARDTYRDSQKEPVKKEPESNDEYFAARDEMIENGIEKYDDFLETVIESNVKITPPMANALLEIDDTDIQVDAAYFLGNNPKEAARIAKLPPVKQIAEIAKLEVKLSTKAKPAKRPSAAPEPIKPVGGSKTSSDEYVDGEPFEAFLKKRNKELGR